MGFRPDGTPFWGESLRASFVKDSAGAVIYDPDLTLRGGGSLTLTAGQSIQVAIRPYTSYLLPGDVAQATWAVEILSGSGTLRLVDGVAPSSSSTAEITHDRGTLTASGLTTASWAATTTTADLVGDDTLWPVARIECVSGTLEVQQVKMRVWPPSGPLGGLSDPVPEPELVDSVDIVQAQAGYDAQQFDPNEAAALDAARAEFLAEYADLTFVPYSLSVGAPPDPRRPSGNAAYSANAQFVNGTSWQANVRANRLHAWVTASQRTRSTPPGVERVDWIQNPNEVDIDTQVVTDGPGTIRFPEWTFGIAEFDGQPPAPWRVEISYSDEPVTTGFPTVPFQYPADGPALSTFTGSATATPTYTPPVVDANYVTLQLVLTTDLAVSAPVDYLSDFGRGVYLEVTDQSNAPSLGLRAYCTKAPYRYWVPAAGPQPRPALQWKSRSDGRGMDSTPSWRRGSATTHAGQWRGTT